MQKFKITINFPDGRIRTEEVYGIRLARRILAIFRKKEDATGKIEDENGNLMSEKK
jgi:hypothetical protein